ncbi:platelet glycoprotein IX [Xenopus laevis]|uniref:Platelet glycoprotein IX n=1 Tax=Xenopus laevis TaxID=8355 RepID=A0A8J0TVY9_XENLA|nr:platelet glycoprotein IX [Xenopus laevis]OCT58710.1 hypothetical protein XELAEV_18001852mg [Xenopus laevis]
MCFCPNLLLLGLMLLGTSDGEICPAPCQCSNKLIIDCSRRELHKVPLLPGATEELDLQQNQLTSIPPGAFDHLVALRKLNLSHNPLHCDCQLRYLHLWLDSEGLNSGAVCLTPPNLNGKPLALVAPTLLTSCSGTLNLCSHFLVTNTFLFLFLFLLLFLMVWSLRTFQGMKFRIKVNENEMKVRKNWTPVMGSLKRRFHFSVNSC